MNATDSRKLVLRKALRAERTAFFRQQPGEWRSASQRALSLLRDSSAWRKAEVVGMYMPILGELDIAPLVYEAMSQGRTVLLPRCRTDNSGVMDFVHCTAKEQLSPGTYNILEPDESCPVVETPPDLLLTPCVGLDRQGYRLGNGGGYYDRHFARPDWQACARPFRLAVIFSLQLRNTLPHDPWDMPLNGWVTEKELVWL